MGKNPIKFCQTTKARKISKPQRITAKSAASGFLLSLELSAMKRMRKNVDALIIAKLFVRS